MFREELGQILEDWIEDVSVKVVDCPRQKMAYLLTFDQGLPELEPCPEFDISMLRTYQPVNPFKVDYSNRRK